MEYCFNLFNKLAADGTAMAVEKFLRSAPEAARGGGTKRPAEKSPEEELELPVVLCIGSDLAIGDSLGPIVGSMLKYKTQGLNCFYTEPFPRPSRPRKSNICAPFCARRTAAEK